MFAVLASLAFLLAFVLLAGAVSVTVAALSFPALLSLGLLFLALDKARDKFKK